MQYSSNVPGVGAGQVQPPQSTQGGGMDGYEQRRQQFDQMRGGGGGPGTGHQTGDFILFYTRDDNVCHKFEKLLAQAENLYNSFLKIDVYNTEYSIPKSITTLPTIKIKGSKRLLKGKEAFDWINAVIFKMMQRDNPQSQDVQPHPNLPPAGPGQQPSMTNNDITNGGKISEWDPSSMGGFSDSFSSWNGGSDTGNKAFESFNPGAGGSGGGLDPQGRPIRQGPDGGPPPPQSHAGGGMGGGMGGAGMTDMDRRMEAMRRSREQDMQHMPQRQYQDRR